MRACLETRAGEMKHSRVFCARTHSSLQLELLFNAYVGLQRWGDAVTCLSRMLELSSTAYLGMIEEYVPARFRAPARSITTQGTHVSVAVLVCRRNTRIFMRAHKVAPSCTRTRDSCIG